MSGRGGAGRSERLVEVLWGVALVAAILFCVGGLLAHGGGAVDDGDSLLTTWILAWDAHQLAHDPLQLFQANLFFPYPDTLAFSEHLLVPALLVAPVYAATGDPLTSHTVALVLSFVLAGLSIHCVLRALGVSRVAAAAGGLLAGTAPIRLMRLGHHHLLHIGFLAPALLFFVLFARSGRRRDGALLLLFLNVGMLSGYYLAEMLLLSLAVLAVLLVTLEPRVKVGLLLRRMLPVALLSLVVQVPFALPYFRVSRQWHFVRTLDECRQFSAEPADYVRRRADAVVAPGASLGGPIRDMERANFCGVLLLPLAAAGLLWWRDGRRRLAAFTASAAALLAFVLSLGPDLRWGAHVLAMPYRAFYLLFPGFKALRVPSRFGILTDLGLCLLAGLGVEALRRRGRLGTAAAALLATGALAERALPRPGPLDSPDGGRVRAVYPWLASRQDVRAVLFLPPWGAAGENPALTRQPYRELYFSTFHFKPMYNGVSGFVPPPFHELRLALEDFPDTPALETIRSMPVDTVVIHRDLLGRAVPMDRLLGQGFRVLYDSPEDLVLRVPERSGELALHSAGLRRPSER